MSHKTVAWMCGVLRNEEPNRTMNSMAPITLI